MDAISQSGQLDLGLKRSLSLLQLVGIGIGCVIGAGIFVMTGQAAANFAGPGVAISFAIAAFGCFLAGLCYSEFASMIPVAGSAYTYTYATLGSLMAWVVGWNLVLEYLATASTVAVGWSGYFNDMMLNLGVPVPAIFNGAPLAAQGFGSFAATGSIINLPAVLLVCVITAVLVTGVTISANLNSAIVAVKVTIILVVIGACYAYIVPANHHPFIPANTGEVGHFGWTGVFRATGVLIFSYLGFDVVSSASQEARNPRRDIPLGMLISLAICAILYMAMAYVLTGIAHYTTLNVAHPVSKAVAAIPQTRWLTQFVNVGAVFGLSSVVLVLLMGQSRIFYAMAKDGMMPPLFRRIHPRFRTPAMGTIVTGLFCAFLAGLLPLDILGQLVSIGTMTAFAIVCVGVMILRVRAPHVPRRFRVPFVWFVAPLGVAMCLFMMAFLPGDTWLRLIVWTLIGLAIYALYSRRHLLPSPYAIERLAED
jgi:basic amino acid/polyamine antiporter, APA family